MRIENHQCNLIDLIEKATAYIQEQGITNPEIGVVLGTGLSKLVDAIEGSSGNRLFRYSSFFRIYGRISRRETRFWRISREKYCGNARSFPPI